MTRRPPILLAALATTSLLVACSSAGVRAGPASSALSTTEPPAATSAPASSTTSTPTTSPTTTTPPVTVATGGATVPVPAGATGTLYALELGGDLVEVDLATGAVRAWPVGEEVRQDAPRGLAVLPEGVIVYEEHGTAVALPFDAPAQPVVLTGERVVAVARDRVVSVNGPPSVRPSTFRLLDGRGQLVAEVPAAGERSEPSFVVVGDSLFRRLDEVGVDLARVSLSSGGVEASPWAALAPPTARRLLGLGSVDEACTLLDAPPGGPLVELGPTPCPPWPVAIFSAALSSDGRRLAHFADADEAGWSVRLLDLQSGSSDRLLLVEAHSPYLSFTPDDQHVVVGEGLADGRASLVRADAAAPPGELVFARPLAAIALGPPMRA